MTYKIFISDDRVHYLINELGEKQIKVLDKPEGFTTTPVEVTIDSSVDLLSVFHAGVKAGIQY